MLSIQLLAAFESISRTTNKPNEARLQGGHEGLLCDSQTYVLRADLWHVHWLLKGLFNQLLSSGLDSEWNTGLCVLQTNISANWGLNTYAELSPDGGRFIFFVDLKIPKRNRNGLMDILQIRSYMVQVEFSFPFPAAQIPTQIPTNSARLSRRPGLPGKSLAHDPQPKVLTSFW